MSRYSILMPKLGLTMTEGVLIEWRVAPGDAVAPGDTLFVVETDKIANEVEANRAGVVDALLVHAGEVVPVGAVVASLRGEGDVAQSGPKAEPPQKRQAPASPARIVATPLARRHAAEAGIDLAEIAGSGPRGRIMLRDLPDTEPSARGQVRQPTERQAIMPRGPIVREPDPHRKITARRLSEAKREIPHFYVFATADVTDLLALREQLNAGGNGPHLTLNHFVVAAVARAMAALPQMDAVWADDVIHELQTRDVGIAVEGAKGLVAPVLRDVAGLTLDEVAAAAIGLVTQAREGRLKRADLEGGAISVSNVGMFGVSALVPIVNPGQSSILGVGASQPMFRPDAQGRPVLRHVLELALSCDHRVIDGALAARFLQDLCRRLETAVLLLRRPQREATP